MKQPVVRFSQIGLEQQPLLVVDDFIPQPEQLIRYALQQGEVKQVAGLYPGLRSVAPSAFGAHLLQYLAQPLQACFGLAPTQLQQVNSYFSMVCTPATELSPMQSIPHFDRPCPDELAAIYYLCGENHGGTSFYRHRSTGYEAITPERQDSYQQALQADFQQHGTPRGYICGDTALFEVIATVPARFNRLVLYRCSSLHSGDIKPDYAYDLNPGSGRFTIASFLSAAKG
jgi:hypothetical protein